MDWLTPYVLQLETSRQDLEIQLNESLRRKADELRSRLETLSASHGESEDSSPAELEARQSEVLTLEKSVSRHTEKMTELEGQIDETQQAVQKLQAELEKLQGQQAEDAKGISRQSKGTERYHSKKSMLESRKEETEGHIRDLGVLPEEAFEKYTDFNSDQLVSKLHNVNDALKKFTGVNKKAVEQFSNFATQKEELEERREELDKSSESIEELLDTLDMRKEEAIERTFKQVSKSFSEVFERLVPSGRGRLIMLKALDGDSVGQDTVEEEEETDGTAMDEDEDEDAPRRRGKKRRVEKGKEPSKKNKKSNQGSSKISNYTGVAIRVSFNSKVDEGLHIQQLSGGQKSLVALALGMSILYW